MLNSVEKFKVTILHIERDWNQCKQIGFIAHNAHIANKFNSEGKCHNVINLEQSSVFVFV